METPKHKNPVAGVTILEVNPVSPSQPIFTPPIPKADKAAPHDAPTTEVVGDGEEFEVVETEEMPAQPHEHGRSDPADHHGSSPDAQGDSGVGSIVA